MNYLYFFLIVGGSWGLMRLWIRHIRRRTEDALTMKWRVEHAYEKRGDDEWK